MKVFLLEKIKKLGKVGDLVTVNKGFAKNYLFIKKKALRLTKENKKRFEIEKNFIKESICNEKKLAIKNKNILEGITLKLIRESGKNGYLYGAINHTDIVNLLKEKFKVNISVKNIILSKKIEKVGLYEIRVKMFNEINVKFKLNIITSAKKYLTKCKKL